MTAQSRQSLGHGVGETHGLDWAETDSGKSFVNRDPQSWGRVPNITLVCPVADLQSSKRSCKSLYTTEANRPQGDWLNRDAFLLGP